ncbi:hypothetical protein [Jatrophihabitans fulvus]
MTWGSDRTTARRGTDVPLLAVAIALVLAGLFHLGVAAVSDRPWDGPLAWRKPATFGVSFGVTLATVVWTSAYLAMPAALRRRLLTVLAVDCVVEVAGITLQAWRDEPSHFNTGTPADAAVAYSLAAGGVVLVVVLGWFTVAAFRGPVGGPATMPLALRTGFGLLVAGLAAGAAMIARGTALVRTGHVAEGYAEGGFLKLFHGVTIHAVLVLPVLAVALDRTAVRRPQRWMRAAAGTYGTVAVAALAYCLATM